MVTREQFLALHWFNYGHAYLWIIDQGSLLVVFKDVSHTITRYKRTLHRRGRKGFHVGLWLLFAGCGCSPTHSLQQSHYVRSCRLILRHHHDLKGGTQLCDGVMPRPACVMTATEAALSCHIFHTISNNVWLLYRPRYSLFVLNYCCNKVYPLCSCCQPYLVQVPNKD